jgi:hypothetical protein
MEPASRGRAAAAIFVLAVLLPSPAPATVLQKPYPLEQIIKWSDSIVVGVTRDSLPSEHYQRTIDVEQWIVPAQSTSKFVRVSGGNSDKGQFGKRVLLFLRELKRPLPFADYSAMQVIDLEDSSDVARAIEEMNSPWIPYVTSATSYTLIDWDDACSHPIKVPTRDPLFLDIDRILNTAWSKIDGR